MDKKRNGLEHDIWVAAYLRALPTNSPTEAEMLAVDAAARYIARWIERHDTSNFDALSRHDQGQISTECDEKAGEISEKYPTKTLRCASSFAFQDADDTANYRKLSND